MSRAGWKETALGDIAIIVMGQSPSGETCNESGDGVPLLNGPTEFGSFYPYPVQSTTDPKKLAEIDDLLFCVRGSTTGRMNWADQRYAIGRGLAAIRHKKGNEFQPFLRGLIDYYLPSLLAEATGSTFPNVSGQQLISLLVEVPDIPTQRSIAAILSALDDKIELSRLTNATLEAIAQAIFKEWFVDFRFPGATGEMQESKLGPIPKGWKIGAVGDLFILSNETMTPSANPDTEYFHYSIPSFDSGRMASIEKGVSILSNKFRVKSYSILVSKLNPRIPRIWGVAEVDEQKSICSTEFQVLLPRKPFFYSFGLNLFFQSSVVETMKSGASGTSGSHQRLKPQDILDIEIAIPDGASLKAYESVVGEGHRYALNSIGQSDRLAQVRDSLLPKLINGDIEV